VLAAEEGYDDVVALLLAAGAAVDKADEDGRTALMRTARCGLSPVVALLLAAGAEVDKADAEGGTALILAVHGVA
jgi:ankyrin repeat protein